MTVALASYWQVFLKSFQKSMVYKLNYFASVLGDLVLTFLAVGLWRALLRDSSEQVPAGVVVTYLILARATRTALYLNLEIETRVRTGDILADLLRPVNFQLYQFVHALGGWVHAMLMRSLPVYLVFLGATGVKPPASAAAFGCFVLGLLMAFATMFAMTFAVALIAFWTNQMWSVIVIRDALVAVFSGLLIPVWFMPERLQQLVAWLPFRTLVDTPVRFYLGEYGTGQVLSELGLELAWLVALLALGHWVWRRAIRKINLQGG